MLVGAAVQELHIDFRVAEDLGDIDEQSDAVLTVESQLRRIAAVLARRVLPLRFHEAVSLGSRKAQDVDAVRAVNGDAAAAGDVTDDLVARHRIAAL